MDISYMAPMILISPLASISERTLLRSCIFSMVSSTFFTETLSTNSKFFELRRFSSLGSFTAATAGSNFIDQCCQITHSGMVTCTFDQLHSWYGPEQRLIWYLPIYRQTPCSLRYPHSQSSLQCGY